MRAAFACLLWLLALPALAQAPALDAVRSAAPGAAEPEARTVTRPAQPPAVARRQMVVAANPLAAEAGLAILRDGGGAVDAAVAMGFVLGLVEPQSAGLGGGGYMTVWHAPTLDLTAFDGRETAPSGAAPGRFLRPDGTPMALREAALGPRSVGVPGFVAMAHLAQSRFGRLPWASVLQPAIALAERGFAVSPRLAALAQGDAHLGFTAEGAAYFRTATGGLAAGTILRNPAYADTLRRIAAEGPDGFYRGPVAADIARITTLATGHNDTGPDEADLAGYRAIEVDPVCGAYRVYRVCGPPPSTSGPTTVIQMLGLLERFDLPAETPQQGAWTAAAAHLFAEAGRLAFADRARWIGDPAFTRVPVQGLVDPGYLAARARLIDPLRARAGAAPAGDPAARRADAGPQAPDQERLPSTTHLVAVDAAGSVVSMTASIESAFGSHLMVRGFLLNNELTDFDFTAPAGGVNAIAAGKRPRSAMSPIVAFDAQGRPVLAAGAAGGPSIIGYVAKMVVAMLDWDLDPAAAAALPNLVNRNGATDIEAGTSLAGIAGPLRAMGHRVRASPLASGIQAVRIFPDRIEGGADPRREGVALGD